MWFEYNGKEGRPFTVKSTEFLSKISIDNLNMQLKNYSIRNAPTLQRSRRVWPKSRALKTILTHHTNDKKSAFPVGK